MKVVILLIRFTIVMKQAYNGKPFLEEQITVLKLEELMNFKNQKKDNKCFFVKTPLEHID